MTTDKKQQSNRQNALGSTGPRTDEGVLACKNNALRHGLRALQIVVPGKDPEEWEAHRTSVVADLRPEGAVELALAEQVAVKLWRLGRVVRHEADLVANAQDGDELARVHERSHHRVICGKPKRADIPTREDVSDAWRERDKAERKLAGRNDALRQLEALQTMTDDEAFPDWALYQALHDDFFHNRADALDDLFDGEDLEGPFLARHARTILRAIGHKASKIATNPDQIREGLIHAWTERLEQLEATARSHRKTHLDRVRRYKAAIERRRRAHGLPGADDLNRIQRYEAHLERGLHKALDRLRDLQEGRGAVPPKLD